ncbi:hypothetical protein ACLOJK_002607 [Asimina triloba]
MISFQPSRLKSQTLPLRVPFSSSSHFPCPALRPSTSPLPLSVPSFRPPAVFLPIPLSRSPSPASRLLSPPNLGLLVPIGQSQPPASSSFFFVCDNLPLHLRPSPSPAPPPQAATSPSPSASSQTAKPPSSFRSGSEFPRHLPNLEGKSSPNPKAETLISSPANIWIPGEKTPFSLPGNRHPRLFFLRHRRPLPLILLLSSVWTPLLPAFQFPYSSSPFMEFEPFSALKSSSVASSSSEQLGTTSGIKDLDSPSSLSPLDPPKEKNWVFLAKFWLPHLCWIVELSLCWNFFATISY